MNREIHAVINVDETKLLKNGEGTLEALEREFGWLEQSGCFLNEARIADADETDEWSRYINYLIKWAFTHQCEEFLEMSPACFDEWRDNEDKEASS